MTASNKLRRLNIRGLVFIMKKAQKHTEETKAKLSKAQKEYLNNNSHQSLGKKLSAETKAKLSELAKGRKHSEEAKAKMSLSQVERHKNNVHPSQGKKRSEESKKKQSITLKKLYKDHPRSEETRMKLSIAHKGKRHTAEHRANNSKARIGKKASAEARLSMSRAGIKRYENPEAIQQNREAQLKRYEENPLTEEQKQKYFMQLKNWHDANPEAMRGENNPAWKGGIACLPYAPIFSDSGYRDILWARHGEVCMNPNCPEKHLDKPNVLHHIDHEKENTLPENQIGLCGSCNGIAENKETWDYYIELYQGITAELNNQEAIEYFNNYYTNFMDLTFSNPEQQLSLLEAVNQ